MYCCITVTVDETHLECFAHFEQNFLKKKKKNLEVRGRKQWKMAGKDDMLKKLVLI